MKMAIAVRRISAIINVIIIPDFIGVLRCGLYRPSQKKLRTAIDSSGRQDTIRSRHKTFSCERRITVLSKNTEARSSTKQKKPRAAHRKLPCDFTRFLLELVKRGVAVIPSDSFQVILSRAGGLLALSESTDEPLKANIVPALPTSPTARCLPNKISCLAGPSANRRRPMVFRGSRFAVRAGHYWSRFLSQFLSQSLSAESFLLGRVDLSRTARIWLCCAVLIRILCVRL